MNRKEKRLALRTAFQSRADELKVVEDFTDKLPRPKTKELLGAIARWGIDPTAKILLILPQKDEMVYLSARNIANLQLIWANQLNIVDLLTADYIVATSSALAKIQEVYSD
jgi:large subunit ribosomal protein L4